MLALSDTDGGKVYLFKLPSLTEKKLFFKRL